MPILQFNAEISSNVLLIAFSLLVTILLVGAYLASRDPRSHFQWTHLITDPMTNKGSLTRVLQLLGGLTGTYVIVWHTLKLSLSSEMFAIYLAALGVSEGFSKWVQLKYKNTNKDNQE